MSDPNPSHLIEQFVTVAARFGAVVDAGGDWSAQSPCDEWATTDVLDHVIDTQRDFLAQRGVEVGAAAAGSPAERWHAHVDQVRCVLTPDSVSREHDGYFGRTTSPTRCAASTCSTCSYTAGIWRPHSDNPPSSPTTNSSVSRQACHNRGPRSTTPSTARASSKPAASRLRS